MAAELQVKQAVYALYSSDPVQQAQANQWLTSFQQSHDAWHVSFRLLGPDQPQELLFFAATLLVRKVKADWGRLEPPHRQELNQAISSKFQEALGWPSVPPLVLRQLCLLLAAVAGNSGGEGANELVTQAKALLGSAGTVSLGLELLGALGEECEDLDRVRRLALVNVMAPRAREVLAWLGQLLASALEQPQGAAGAEQLATAAIKCADAWLRLSQVAGGGSVLTPGELHAQQPQLFQGVLSALAGGRFQAPPVLDAASQLLLLLYGVETFSGNDEDVERAATAATLDALAGLRGRLSGAGAEALAGAVTLLGSALAERSPEWVAGELPQAVALSELMLECLSRPEPAVAENSLEYFLMINTVPLEERAPLLRSALYEAMLRTLVHHVALPQHFTSWEEECELDQDAFDRLRETMLPESLETAYGLLRSGYLGFAWQLLQSAASWQQAEAALYFFTAVSMSVKGRVMALAGASGAGTSDENAGASVAPQDAQQAQQLLVSLFGQLCSPEGTARMAAGHPLLARAACSLLDAYAAWIARAAEAPLQGSFQLCIASMRVPEASGAAAKAFQSLCLRCAWKLRDPQAVQLLIDAASPLLQPEQPAAAGAHQGPLSLAGKQALVEGLARLVAGLQPPRLQEMAGRLTEPFTSHATALVRAHAGAANGAAAAAPSAQARRALAEALQLTASALRFLAFGTALGGGPEAGAAAAGSGGDGSGGAAADHSVQPVVRVLEDAGEALQAVVASPGWYGDEGVAAAAGEVYRRAICSARKQGAVLLPAVLPALVLLFERAALPGCLDAVSDVVEIHYQEGGPTQEALAHALGVLCAAAFPRLQAGLQEQHGLASSLLNLADQFAVYLPAQLWASPLLAPLLQLATACLRLRETDPVSHALALLGRCVSAHQRGADDEVALQQAHVDAVDAALLGQGEELVRALLAAECDTCPRQLMRTAADCLYKLTSHAAVGQAAGGWLAAVLAAGQLPGVASGHLTAEDCSQFCAIALGGGVRGARFVALVVDFGLLARGQNTADVLLAYQM